MPQLKAVMFDWAGTTVDYGSRAPVEAFIRLFQNHDVKITPAEARGPMGTAKRDHIAALLMHERIRNAWAQAHGRPPGDADLDTLYREFLPLQKSVLAEGCDVIPRLEITISECHKRGLRIGSTTGYTREVMDVIAPRAAAQGFAPEVTVCADDVAAGRPAPWMNFRAAEKLGVYPMSGVVVVDDTEVGIEAGVNSGAWTVAVCRTGNALGLSEREIAALPSQEVSDTVSRIASRFLTLGADFAVPSIADLPAVFEAIEQQS